MSESMVVAAAKVLCRRGADLCQVDPDDSWKIYGETYIEDAQAVLEACGALDLLAVAKRMLDFALGGGDFAYPLGSLQDLEQAISKAEWSQHG